MNLEADTMMTLPRDITMSQLWMEDSSLSSLESFSEEESSDDESSTDEEEQDVCGLRRGYASNHKLVPAQLRHKKKHTTKRSFSRQHSPPSLPRRATFQNGYREDDDQPEQTPLSRWGVSRSYERVPSSLLLSCPRRGPARPNADSSSSGAFVSPMAKFRSNTSDSALSASRSSQNQRLRVSQANAKWNGLIKKRGIKNVFAQTVNDSLLKNSSILGGGLPTTESDTTATDFDSAVGSRETRWSTSTHTKDAALSVCRRRGSSASLLDLHDSEESDPEEEHPQKFSDSATGPFLDKLVQNNSNARAFSMEDALQQVLAIETDEDDAMNVKLELELEFPQVSVPRSDRTACSADSLVGLMSPFSKNNLTRLPPQVGPNKQ